jgi:hypothetical protein
MLELKQENVQGLEMSFTLDERQQAILAAHIKTEAFDLLQKLMEQEIRLLNIKLMNTSDPQDILRNHAVAKGAAMFYAGLLQRLQTLLQLEQIKAAGIGTLENPEKPTLLDEVS